MAPNPLPPLPVIDLSPLSLANPSKDALRSLSQSLHHALSTTGFLYLSNPPLTSAPAATIGLAQSFFSLPSHIKQNVAKTSFNPDNSNTYRGFFPPQPTTISSNLKEGFDLGPPSTRRSPERNPKERICLDEPSVWPSFPLFQQERHQLEQLHIDLQSLSQTLLSLLAQALGKEPTYFTYLEPDSISTLRLLHYPSSTPPTHTHPSPNSPATENVGGDNDFSCSSHTDSGLLTLLTQDSTGGLEVLLTTSDRKEEWTPIPPLPGTLVVNVGDLMAYVTGGRYKATMHRVRRAKGRERWSVPFFFEPGERCVVRPLDVGEREGGSEGEGQGEKDGVVYGEHVRGKMRGWVEFQEREKGDEGGGGA